MTDNEPLSDEILLMALKQAGVEISNEKKSENVIFKHSGYTITLKLGGVYEFSGVGEERALKIKEFFDVNNLNIVKADRYRFGFGLKYYTVFDKWSLSPIFDFFYFIGVYCDEQ